MLGETNFLTAKLWHALRESSDGSMWSTGARRAWENRDLFESAKDGLLPDKIPNDAEWSALEDRRIASIVNRSITELFDLSRLDKQFWGMKEIWNGGAKSIDWGIYDLVFPEAIWIHVVRHPLGYIRSALGWEGHANSAENLVHQLKTWSQIVHKSRERIACERYIEIRYEDLLSDACAAMQGIWDLLGIEWHNDCLNPTKQNWVATKQLPEIDIEQFQESVDCLGIRETLLKLGYQSAEMTEQRSTSYSKLVEYDTLGNLIISQGIQKCLGPYWIFALSTAPAIRDELESLGGGIASLTDAILFEDGVPLSRWENPQKFYCSRPGSFFCNDTAIIFTSSDGSDPIINGRCYAIRLAALNG